jgi:4-hydroxy-tetrahydrodipicolinate synthase
VYSGIELLCYPVLAIGGAGYIGAPGNLLPRKVACLYDLVSAIGFGGCGKGGA